MAILISGNSQGIIPALVERFGKSSSPSSAVSTNISTESMDFVVTGVRQENNRTWQNDFNKVCDSIRADVKGLALDGVVASSEEKDLGFENGAATEAQINAAAYIHMAVTASKENLVEFFKRGIDTSVESAKDVTVFGMPTGDGFQYLEANTSLESFDARNLEKMRGINVAVAFAAAIQDEYGEAFFRTVTVTSDTAGFEIETRISVVEKEIEHPQTGQWTGWKQHNLIDAFTDPTILLDDSTKLYPQVLVGNPESEMLFVPVTDIAPRAIIANGGAPIQTAPLRVGVSIPLLGVSYNEKIPGKQDQVVSIDGDVRIDKAYFKVTTASGSSIIAFNAAAFDGNGFLKSAQFRDRRLALDFPFNDFMLDGETLDIAGVPAVALDFMRVGANADMDLRIGGLIGGELDTEWGNVLVNPAVGELRGVRVIRGENDYENVTDKTVISAINAQLQKIELIGYEVDGRRANLDRRQMGIFTNTVTERVRYQIPLHPPVSIRRPLTDTSNTADMASALHAVRTRNSLHAVSMMFNIRENLRQAVKHISYTTPTDRAPAIQGYGRLLVRPVLYEDNLNVADILQNNASTQRTKDVGAAIMNKIKFLVTKAYTESRYQLALNGINGTVGERPVVVIGTDPTTAAYLQIEGDPRAFAGLGFKHKIVVSYDYRHRNKIACSFVRENVNEVDVLSHGVMANIPELVTQIALPYNGGIADTTQVQGRTRHIALLPIQVWIDLEGLEQAASDRVDFKTTMI